MRSFNAAFYCKLYHRNASYKNSYKQSTLWTIETSSFHQNHPKSCTLFVQNLVVSPFILLQLQEELLRYLSFTSLTLALSSS